MFTSLTYDSILILKEYNFDSMEYLLYCKWNKKIHDNFRHLNILGKINY